nr:hypothetical protein [Tanacetum cinerariifolium]
MQTQTSNTLHNAIMEAGSKDRPPMLAPGNYIQWKSRIKRYINTKPNHELIYFCLTNPPYELGWKEKLVLDSEGNPTTATQKSSTMNPNNMNELDMEEATWDEATWDEVPKGINTTANSFGDFPPLSKVTSPRPLGDKDASNVHNIDDIAMLFDVPLNTVKDMDDFFQDLYPRPLGDKDASNVYNIDDIAMLFDVPLNTVKDMDDFFQDLYEYTSIPKSVPIVDDLSTKVSPSTDDNLSSKDSLGDPIVHLVYINTKSTSYAGVAGSSIMVQPQVSSFRLLVADLVFNGVNISIP